VDGNMRTIEFITVENPEQWPNSATNITE